MDTLYKKDKGKVRFWSIDVPEDAGFYSIKTGLLESIDKLSPKIYKTKTTNKGKTNERDATEQAISESNRKWKDKREKEGWKSLDDLLIVYKPNNKTYLATTSDGRPIILDSFLEVVLDKVLEEKQADINNNLLPALCKPYKDLKTATIVTPIIYPTIAQPKLDGFRVICRYEQVEVDKGSLFAHSTLQPIIRSKNGLEYSDLTYIKNDFVYIFSSIKVDVNGNLIGYKSIPNNTLNIKDLVFDGEVYKHGLKRQEIASACTKANHNTEHLLFMVFDLSVANIPQKARISLYNEILANHGLEGRVSRRVRPHASQLIKDETELEAYFSKCLNFGFEGIVCKNPNSLYQFGKRTNSWIKYKKYIEEEYTIIDVTATNKDNFEGHPISLFVCKLGELQFTVTPAFTKEERYLQYKNKKNYIGKTLTIRYYDYYSSGIPDSAIGVEIH